VLSEGRSLLNGFLQLIYPHTCWVCGGFISIQDERVCAGCLAKLSHDPFPACPHCGSTVGPHLDLDEGCPACRKEAFVFGGVVRMGPYDGLLREVILRMKHWTGEELTEVIGAIWARKIAERVRPLHADMVVPVPLHWSRRWWRGFNQSDILAACLSRELRVPCVRALRRERRGSQQKQLSGPARRDNVHRAFQCRAGFDFSNRTILLVDDVMTSGATANESARALRLRRPRAVHVAVMAHG
jgi:ComF family protein